MAFTYPIDLLGFTVSGDIGGLTAYTDRFGKKVFYPKSPPKEPPTAMQVVVRTAFKNAQAEYSAKPPSVKYDWECLANRANLCMTGQNLYIHTAMVHDFDCLDTLMRQTGVTVDHPTAQPRS